MSGHTPGPWRWDDSYSTIDGRGTWTLVDSDGSGILSCDGLVNSPQEIGCGSEAHMIAAAPELLEALEMYVAVVGNTGYALSRESAAELYESASAVIAKATGEQS